MKIPFTTEQFLKVFETYNQAVWPLQVVFYLLAGVVIFLAVKNKKVSDKIISLILAFFWLWMGMVYHLYYFTAINPAAYLFGAAFMLQGVLFVQNGFVQSRLAFQPTIDLYGIIGALLMLFALIVYPVLGYSTGHGYPSSPTFGLPCPTTIFTFGMLLWTQKPVSGSLLIIPFLWSVVGVSAAWQLGIHEDIGLLVAGLIATPMLLIRNRSRRAQASPESPNKTAAVS